MKHSSLFVMMLIVPVLSAQPYNTSITTDSDWYGWEAVLVENELIATATVPAIGARVMQYDLGTHQSIYHNHSLDGDTFTPRIKNNYDNFGGFKNWPSPQWGQEGWGWPPPPTLDYGEYTFDPKESSDDSVLIRLASQIEQYRTPDLQFVREMTLYKNSSRVKMKQILVNHGSSEQTQGIWDNTQSIVKHTGETDYEYFWTYFPINPQSEFGSDGVRTDKPSPAWVGEVATGIYGTQFVPNAQKLFADPDKGWICHVDERDGVAYAKTFPVFEGSSYPDEGARIAVYMGVDYVEVEVMGPVETIPADGGQIEFIIDWWAAKVNGPILNVNNVGAVNQFLKLSGETLTGNYGIFHVGTVKAVFINDAGIVAGEGLENAVTPLENFAYSEIVSIPENTSRIELRAYTPDGTMIGTLDGDDLENLTGVKTATKRQFTTFELSQNYPNPFNPSTQMKVNLNRDGNLKLIIYDVTGRMIRVLSEGFHCSGEYCFTWNGHDLNEKEVPAGVYLCYMEFTDYANQIRTMTKKMHLIR